MKNLFLMCTLLLVLNAFAQDKFLTTEEAKEIMEAHSHYRTIEVTKLDTLYSLFENSKMNDVIITKHIIYEVHSIKESTVYNCGYIYFDGKKLDLRKIDRLRKTVLNKYKNGASFESLIKEYNMDRNPNAANFTFSDGIVVEEFSIAVKNHLPGDIFTIDVPDNKWYYVAKRNPDAEPEKVFKVRYYVY